MDYKLILMLLGTGIALVNYTLYLRHTFEGKFKPHMFTWGIWTMLAAIAFAAQWTEDAGYGMWQLGVMTIGTAVITVVAFFKGDRHYTRSDWIALLSSLLAIPLWMATDDPVWSVILVSIIDMIASWPTLRKSWADPTKESPQAFFLSALISGLGFGALSVVNVTTGLYQGTVTAVNLLIALMILYRRRALAR